MVEERDYIYQRTAAAYDHQQAEKRRRARLELAVTVFVVALVTVTALVTLWAVYLRDEACTTTRQDTAEGAIVTTRCR